MSDTDGSAADDTVFSVATLLKYMGNDDKALAIVIKIVRDACAPGRAPLEQARAAIDAGQLEPASKIFHGLRGSVGSLGARRLVASALALEQAMLARDMDQLPALLAAVDADYDAVLAAAEAWLAQQTPPAALA